MGRSKEDLLHTHIRTLIQYAKVSGRADGPARIEAAVQELLSEKLDSWFRAILGDWTIEDLLALLAVIESESKEAAKAKVIPKAARSGKN